jgi:hypothetical protein
MPRDQVSFCSDLAFKMTDAIGGLDLDISAAQIRRLSGEMFPTPNAILAKLKELLDHELFTEAFLKEIGKAMEESRREENTDEFDRELNAAFPPIQKKNGKATSGRQTERRKRTTIIGHSSEEEFEPSDELYAYDSPSGSESDADSLGMEHDKSVSRSSESMAARTAPGGFRLAADVISCPLPNPSLLACRKPAPPMKIWLGPNRNPSTRRNPRWSMSLLSIHRRLLSPRTYVTASILGSFGTTISGTPR